MGLTFSFSFKALLVGPWDKKKTSPPTVSGSVPAPGNKTKCEYEPSADSDTIYSTTSLHRLSFANFSKAVLCMVFYCLASDILDSDNLNHGTHF